MSIKYADEVIEEIEERGPIQVPNGYVTGEEFDRWLIEKNIGLTREEIAECCRDILDMLNEENDENK